MGTVPIGQLAKGDFSILDRNRSPSCPLHPNSSAFIVRGGAIIVVRTFDGNGSHRTSRLGAFPSGRHPGAIEPAVDHRRQDLLHLFPGAGVLLPGDGHGAAMGIDAIDRSRHRQAVQAREHRLPPSDTRRPPPPRRWLGPWQCSGCGLGRRSGNNSAGRRTPRRIPAWTEKGRPRSAPGRPKVWRYNDPIPQRNVISLTYMVCLSGSWPATGPLSQPPCVCAVPRAAARRGAGRAAANARSRGL